MARTDDPFARVGAALIVGLTHPDREIAAIGQYGPEWRLLGCRHIIGRASHLAIPVRTVVIDALAFGSHAVMIAHSHPSGDPAPSAIDIAYTRALARTLAAIDLWLADHLIVGAGGGVVSLRRQGLL